MTNGSEDIKQTDCARVTYTDSIDVWLMASESLSAHSFSDVPELGRSIAGSRDKHPGVRCQRQTHHITCVTSKRGRLLTGLDVPQSTAKQFKTQVNLSCNKNQHLWYFALFCAMSRNQPNCYRWLVWGGHSINILIDQYRHKILLFSTEVSFWKVYGGTFP